MRRGIVLLVAAAVVGVAILVVPPLRRLVFTSSPGVSLHGFSVGQDRYSVRAYKGPADTTCAGLYRWTRWRDANGDRRRGWRRQQQASCSWQRTTDGTGWVADAAYVSIAGTDQRVFFGAVPDQVATVRLTLSTGPAFQATTVAAKDLSGRFYAVRRSGFEPAGTIDSKTAIQWIKITALDAAGRRLVVY